MFAHVRCSYQSLPISGLVTRIQELEAWQADVGAGFLDPGLDPNATLARIKTCLAVARSELRDREFAPHAEQGGRR